LAGIETTMHLTVSLWPNARSGLIGKPDGCQRHPGEADAEFLHRRAARHRLGQTLGEFIKLVVHSFSCSSRVLVYWQVQTSPSPQLVDTHLYPLQHLPHSLMAPDLRPL
jgi:hypothetical protein